MKLKKYAYLCSKQIGNYTLKIMKNTWKFTKKPGKIMEISWNFVNPEKWEPCLKLSVINFFQFCCSQTRNLPRITVLVPMSNQSCAKPWAWILGTIMNQILATLWMTKMMTGSKITATTETNCNTDVDSKSSSMCAWYIYCNVQ